MFSSMRLLLPISLPKSLFVSAILVASALAAMWLTPKFQASTPTMNFEQSIPKEFGDWKAVLDPYAQVSLTTNNNEQINLLYDQVLMRTYANSAGERVMLALAYASEQKQDVKIHRPEVCYVAQGFKIVSQANHTLSIPPSTIPVSVQRLLMANQNRYEAVSYWIRIGQEYPANGYAARWQILREGIKGKILDGILVRASTALTDPAGASVAYAKQEAFLNQLVHAMQRQDVSTLIVD